MAYPWRGAKIIEPLPSFPIITGLFVYRVSPSFLIMEAQFISGPEYARSVNIAMKLLEKVPGITQFPA